MLFLEDTITEITKINFIKVNFFFINSLVYNRNYEFIQFTINL